MDPQPCIGTDRPSIRWHTFSFCTIGDKQMFLWLCGLPLKMNGRSLSVSMQNAQEFMVEAQICGGVLEGTATLVLGTS